MIRTILSMLVLAVLPAAADTGELPPVEWGLPPAEIVATPHLCRGPLEVGKGIAVYLCTEPVLDREALISLYFVDGAYAAFSVTMQSAMGNYDQSRKEFAALVDRFEASIGASQRNGDATNGDSVVIWTTDAETFRAVVDGSGATPLIGIVAIADEHRQRVASVLSW